MREVIEEIIEAVLAGNIDAARKIYADQESYWMRLLKAERENRGEE